jgi:hypothetical protein
MATEIEAQQPVRSMSALGQEQRDVRFGAKALQSSCPLYPRKRTFVGAHGICATGAWRPPIESKHHGRKLVFRRPQSSGRSVSRRTLIKKPDFDRGKNGNDDANDDVDLHRRSSRKTHHPGRNQDPHAHD